MEIKEIKFVNNSGGDVVITNIVMDGEKLVICYGVPAEWILLSDNEEDIVSVESNHSLSEERVSFNIKKSDEEQDG